MDIIMYNCNKCDKQFYRERYLRAHLKRIHEKHLLKDRTTEGDRKFVECSLCDEKFKSKNTESKHRIRIHGKWIIGPNIFCQEDGCDEKFTNLHEFRKHLKTIHDYDKQDNSVQRTFKCKEEFDHWLGAEQQTTKCNFVGGGRKECKTYVCKRLNCSRSGHYNSRSFGKRKLKVQGSKKVGYHCTAQMILKEYKNEITLKYYNAHYKHDFSLCHFKMSMHKNTAAGKFIHGVSDDRTTDHYSTSMDRTIHDNRAFTTVNENSMENEVFIKKDLKNIVKETFPSSLNNTFDSINGTKNNSEITKEDILNKINTLTSKLHTISSLDPLIARQIINASNTIDNLLNINISGNIIPNNSQEPTNKKIVVQKRFLFRLKN